MSLEVSIRKRFPAFELDVSFSAQDETLGFLGASGCGKSLTLRCIAGIETPDEGRIVVNGRVFFDSEQGVNLTPQERKTALLFQDYMLFPNLTVAENVAAGLNPKLPKAERRRIVETELRRFGLDGFGGRYPAQLSGGQRQRVALARMLAAEPGILMLDEPFSALDAHLKGVLEQNLANLFEGFSGTILYVSHDIDEALRFCDRIAVVESGRIVEMPTGDELVSRPASTAGLKLSGCKNATPVGEVSDFQAWCPKWGVHVGFGRDSFALAGESCESLGFEPTHLGIRARHVERAEGPGRNCFRVRVDRATDARFDRMLLLAFLDRDEKDSPTVSASEDEMRFLHQHLFWTVPTMGGDRSQLPRLGEELWIRIPEERVRLVREGGRV